MLLRVTFLLALISFLSTFTEAQVCNETVLLEACSTTPSACYAAACTEACQEALSVFKTCCVYADLHTGYECVLKAVNQPLTQPVPVYTPQPACTNFDERMMNCAAQTNDFIALPLSQKASCLCYNSNGAWDPGAFDSAYDQCYGYITKSVATIPAAASSSLHSALSKLEASGVIPSSLTYLGQSPCVTQGNVRHATTTVVDTTTTQGMSPGPLTSSTPSQTVMPSFAAFSSKMSSKNAVPTGAATTYTGSNGLAWVLAQLVALLYAL